MNIIIVAILSAVTKCHSVKLRVSCVLIRGKYYERELLTNKVYVPYQMTVDYGSNTLFFGYTGEHINSNGKMSLSFELAFLNLRTKHLGYITEVYCGFATAVDNIDQYVYIGGRNGIYRVNEDSNTAKSLDLYDVPIWQMFYRDGLYFTTYPDQEAFFYSDKNGTIEQILYENDNKVRMVAVKKDGDLVFSNFSGLYTCDQTGENILYVGNYSITGFTSDVDNNLYFSTVNKIYYFGDKVEELADLGDLFGLAIAENGDFIYGTRRSIFRLKPTTKKCYIAT